jgi:predicted aspartyl protease
MEMKRLGLMLVAVLALTAARAGEMPATMSSEGVPPADESQGEGNNAAPAPAAEGKPVQCRLLRMAEMELTTQINGTVTVPATFENEPGQMLVDTGAVMSGIVDTLAIKLRLNGHEITGARFELMGGVRMTTMAQVRRFSLGGMPANGIILIVAPYSALNNDTSGILGADVMAHYDVELDFAAATFRLFSREHCPGQVVYWTHQNYAEVPFKRDADNHMLIDVVLDGKTITAAVDTGAERSTMTMDDFESIFGYRAKSDPRMQTLGHVSINGTESSTISRYPFQAMTFEGIQVQNPNIAIVDGGDRFDPGKPKLVLGIETLRQLHMYIAYGEQKLYLTAAEAR